MIAIESHCWINSAIFVQTTLAIDKTFDLLTFLVLMHKSTPSAYFVLIVWKQLIFLIIMKLNQVIYLFRQWLNQCGKILLIFLNRISHPFVFKQLLVIELSFVFKAVVATVIVATISTCEVTIIVKYWNFANITLDLSFFRFMQLTYVLQFVMLPLSTSWNHKIKPAWITFLINSNCET